MFRSLLSRRGIFLIVATAALTPAPLLADSPTHPAVVFPLIAPKLSSDFGIRRHPIYRTVRHHSGVDLQAPADSHVRSVSAGRVIFAGVHGSFGKLVTILHAGGYSSLYGHLSDIRVNIGDSVTAGEVIGRVGSSGAATAPHLHFEWRHDGVAKDPLTVFPDLTIEAEG